MVCGGNKSEEQVKSDNITVKLSQQIEEEHKTKKLLLLGAGESGKSTIFKQMKIINKNPYTSEECIRYKEVIKDNILQGIKVLVTQKDILFPVTNHDDDDDINHYENLENKFTAEQIRNMSSLTIVNNSNQLLTPELGKTIFNLWKDKMIQKTFKERNKFQLGDNIENYLNDVIRISDKDYIPNQLDVLRSRQKTVGIVTQDFIADKYYPFKMIDVGGQRNERRKWIHVFDDVTAIIFVTSLSEYDQTLFEDETMNRMEESLNLFLEISQSRYFRNTPIIMFYNKNDLFQEKIKTTDLKICFKDYNGGCNYKSALEHIKKQFQLRESGNITQPIGSGLRKVSRMNQNTLNQLNNNVKKKRQFFEHVTVATDTDNIKKVFEDVKSTILIGNLNTANLI